ncbi:MAG: hypothetical protein IPI49_29445 [Myxococcales bacterium]|nr:hypothetical protein [Myxococcales bacterium]
MPGGDSILDWLKQRHPGSHGNADYSAHFFRRCDHLLGDHGTIGLLATNTIAQGDTRATGLQALVASGTKIYAATRSMPWPGDAAVAVSVVHLEKGRCHSQRLTLDGVDVPEINSRLRAGSERPDPVKLKANEDKSFQGTTILGMGFTLTPDERDRLVAKNPKNAERIFPYLGGDEINSSPTQSFERYVINFGDLSLEEAGRWPDLLQLVREKVKPERDKNNRETYRTYWWHFGEKRPALAAAVAPLSRCLVASRHTKHLCFVFQPVQRVFSEATNVFAFSQGGHFASFSLASTKPGPVCCPPR